MAERVEMFSPTVPTGTAITVPLVVALPMNEGVTERLEIVVPPGPSGFMGFRIRHSSQVIIPFAANDWIVANDEQMDWKLEGYPTGDRWSIEMYNTGIYDHTVYLRFFLNEIPSRPAPALTPLIFE